MPKLKVYTRANAFAVEQAQFILETKCRHWARPGGLDHLTVEALGGADKDLCLEAMMVLRQFGLLEEGLFRGNVAIRRELLETFTARCRRAEPLTEVRKLT